MNYSIAAEARWTANQIDAYLNAQERAGEAIEAWDAEYPDWRDLSLPVDHRDRNLIPESFVAVATHQDRQDLADTIAWEEYNLY